MFSLQCATTPPGPLVFSNLEIATLWAVQVAPLRRAEEGKRSGSARFRGPRVALAELSLGDAGLVRSLLDQVCTFVLGRADRLICPSRPR